VRAPDPAGSPSPGTSVAPFGVFVGLATLDVVHEVGSVPGPDRKVTAERQHVAAGGPATNAAITFAALGGRAVLVTALGPGPIARMIREEVEQWGVTVVDTADDAHEPPISAIVVDRARGTRSVTSPDARGARLRPTATDVAAAAITEEVDVVLVDGHHPDLALATTGGPVDPSGRTVAPSDRPTGAGLDPDDRTVDVVLDAGRWKPVMTALVPRLSAMICSADLRLPGLEDDEQERSAAALVALGVPLVATTHGPAPIRWWYRGEAGALDVRAVEAPDTLGAGDALHGAYAFAAAQARGTLRAIVARPAPGAAFSRGTPQAHPATTGGEAARDPITWLRFAADIATIRCATPGPRGWLEHLPPRPGGHD
jgi:sugar/nucleoside kinase (ribokinase family)